MFSTLVQAPFPCHTVAMTTTEIAQGSLHTWYQGLYGTGYDAEKEDSRYLRLVRIHQERFGEEDPLLFSTSGRTEICGNHTDHNQGKVITASINLDTIAAVSRRQDANVVFASEGYPVVEIGLEDLAPRQEERGTSAALVRGVLAAMQKSGVALCGWQANASSLVLPGSGLSSSASLEVLLATICNTLGGGSLTPIELAQIGQEAENTYFGKPSGLLDQLGCAQGGLVAVDFQNPGKPRATPLSLDFSSHGYAMIVTDTKGDHAGLTDAYAAIPKEMKEVAALLGAKNLRATNERDFFSRLALLRQEEANDRALLRAIHFYEEDRRVDAMVRAITHGDFPAFLALVEASGTSSWCLLQNVYVPTQPKIQPLSLALAAGKAVLGGDGACRVHGGGFAGTIQAYVPVDRLDAYTSCMEALFGKGCCTKIAVRTLPTTGLKEMRHASVCETVDRS